MIIEGIEQRTPEWLQMRCGCVTASRVCDVMAKLKRSPGEAADKTNYRKELVAERLTGRAEDHYVSPYMEYGMDTEPLAKAAYEIRCDTEVKEVGIAAHPRIKYFLASPDGLIGDDGVLEVKCLKAKNHIDILETGIIPVEFHWQMLAEMVCAERSFCDFVSFRHDVPKKMQLLVHRFKRDEESIKLMEAEVEKFIAEVEDKIKLLDRLANGLNILAMSEQEITA